MVIAYCTLFSLTFAFVLNAFIKDHSAAKRDFKAWSFVFVAALLWPLTLPFIINSKLRLHKLHSHTKSSFSPTLETAPITDVYKRVL